MILKHSQIWFISSLIFAITASSCTGAQDDTNQKVSLPLSFQSGASADISYTKTLRTNQASGTAVVKATASLEILSTDQNKPVITWILKTYEVEEETSKASAPVIEKLFLEIPTQFIADKKGAPNRLHNTKNLIEKITENAKLPKFKGAEYNGFVSMLDLWVNPTNEKDAIFLDTTTDFTTDFLNALFLEIPELISLCHGTDLVIGELKEYQEEFEGFGQSLKMNVQYQLSSIDKTNRVATINFKTTSDKETQKQALTERRKSLDLPQLSEKEINDALIWSEERAQCLVNSESGWVQEMVYGIQLYHSSNFEQKDYKIRIDWN